MLVRVNDRKHHIPGQSSPRAAGDIENTELDCLSLRRHLPRPANPIAAVTKMGREQTIPLNVEHSELAVGRALSVSMRLMQNCRATGCQANCDVDRHAHNHSLPGTCQGLEFLVSLF